MRILAYKPDHDGHVACVADGALEFSFEAEKDSMPRFHSVGPDLLSRSMHTLTDIPDVVATSGWVRSPIAGGSEGAGYYGVDAENRIDRAYRFLGREIRYFSSSHERSHLFASYGMSPFRQGRPCYALVWEGHIGSFYYIDEQVRIEKIGTPLRNPGMRYSLLYALADPTFTSRDDLLRAGCAGKLMALTSFGTSDPATPVEQETIDSIFNLPGLPNARSLPQLRKSPYCNGGLETGEFKQLARKFSDALFDRFYRFARERLTPGHPLLVSGGCGLNCDWNSAWRNCGLFSDVFVPPCANDTGAAIGTAIDAQHHYTGNAKIQWSVYAGEEFLMDAADLTGIEVSACDLEEVAGLLAQGRVVAWVQGRCEIGPRALGNRSLLAAPFDQAMQARLNEIKQREGYRPIAPVCLVEDLGEHFAPPTASPHMLYFQKVKTDHLAAVTHVDGTARVQSVSDTENPRLHALLRAFKQSTGTGVLCNTSLNFKGAGFINRLSDLVRYATTHGVDAFVVGETLYKVGNPG